VPLASFPPKRTATLCDNDGRVDEQDGDRPDGGRAPSDRERRSMQSSMTRWMTAGLLLLLASAGWADGPTPAAPPPSVPVSAERFFQEGLAAQKKKDWRKAAQAYEAAVKEREAFPEAWNGLGYSLRQQGKYPEAIKAYDRALKLRPDYAEALEYLGEAYVKMGKLDDARAVLGRLEPLDKKEAAELRAAIDKAKK
jgi:tetratricopeptide (TPR) repeat protein